MYVPCILSNSAVWTWFKSMRTLFSRLKKKKSGQAAKAHTARQKWTLSNFQFLSAHLCIWMDTSQLGRVPTPSSKWIWRGRIREEMMMPPPVSPSARCPVSCPAHPRLAPVKHHETGGPGQRSALALEIESIRPS